MRFMLEGVLGLQKINLTIFFLKGNNYDDLFYVFN